MVEQSMNKLEKIAFRVVIGSLFAGPVIGSAVSYQTQDPKYIFVGAGIGLAISVITGGIGYTSGIRRTE